MPTAEVRLLSPQVLLQTVGGHTIQTTSGVDISLNNGIKVSAAYCQQSNLPAIPLMHQEETSCFWSSAFGFNMANIDEINRMRPTLLQININLSSSQKELLQWHQRLSHALISWVQSLMHNKSFLPCDNDCTAALHIGPFIKTKSRAPTCDTMSLKCAACLCAKAAVQSPENTMAPKSIKNKLLKKDHLQPGNCISADHYISQIHGRVPTGFGKEQNSYSCGCLFVDHASGKIFNFAQYSTTANETIDSALHLEALARDEGLTIKHYHSDNGVFLSSKFKRHCDTSHIKYSFSGVGAKHQNGIAEQNIKTAAQLACANMLHLANHWPQYASAKSWPQAINYAIWVFSNLPNMESGITPNKLWSRSKSRDNILARAHVFGCPVYVLMLPCKMERKYLNGPLKLALVCFLVSQNCTPCKYPSSSMLSLVKYLCNFT
jgi:hypothetical protein